MSGRIIPGTIAAVLCSIFVILALTNLVIDPYIRATNWGVNLFEFYENNIENNKIYFIGDSQTVFGIDAVTIENTMRSKNNLSLKIYNIAYPSDSPGSRIVELRGIADSKPKIVVFCFPYFWLNPYFGFYNAGDYREIRSLLASDKINLDLYTQSLFNKTELNLIKMDALQLIVYKRRFLIPGIEMMLFNLGLTRYDPVAEYFNRSAQPEFNKGMLDFKGQFDPGDNVQEPFLRLCPYGSEADNKNKQAMRYMIGYLKERGIHVIIINMPMSPYFHCQSTTDYSKTLSDFSIQVGCPYYDLLSFCSTKEFRDSAHANNAGRRNITRKMTDILLIEAKNVSQ
jgi:hypothetical protein